jgi:hypothetical protein
MNAGFTSFEQIIEGIKTETGITNLMNRYNQVRELILRAETEINPYSGFLIKKKMLLFKQNGIFDGSSIKKPFDFVSVDKVGSCEDGLCEGSYFETESHIVICDKDIKKKESIVYTYWALHFDRNGNPMVTNNHKEAVIAFIIWKLYSSKVFMGNGNRAVKLDYQREFEERLHEARGEDFMTTNMNPIYLSNMMSGYEMYLESKRDICLCSSSCITSEEENPDETLHIMNVYYWQNESPSETLQDILLNLNQEFIDEIETKQLWSIFEQGYIVPLSEYGKLCFLVQYTNLDQFQIFDSLNNDVTDKFEQYYIESLNAMFFVSVVPYSYSNIYFRFKKLNTINVN